MRAGKILLCAAAAAGRNFCGFKSLLLRQKDSAPRRAAELFLPDLRGSVVCAEPKSGHKPMGAAAADEKTVPARSRPEMDGGSTERSVPEGGAAVIGCLLR